MGMTMTQKILAAHAGLPEVGAGQLIEAKLDLCLGNDINIGLAILECDEAARDIQAGDEVKVDVDTGLITNRTTGKTYQAEPFPPFSQNIIQKGGLLASIQDRL